MKRRLQSVFCANESCRGTMARARRSRVRLVAPRAAQGRLLQDHEVLEPLPSASCLQTPGAAPMIAMRVEVVMGQSVQSRFVTQDATEDAIWR
jgi:hypothetical protein